jgi:hypothetical protein
VSAMQSCNVLSVLYCLVHQFILKYLFLMIQYPYKCLRQKSPSRVPGMSWSGARTPDAVGPVTCAVTRNVRSARYPVDIRLLEIETEIVFLEIENRDSFLLRVHSFH